MGWLICIALSALGQVGLSYPEMASRQGIFVSHHIDVPFGTLISLAELIEGISLVWKWFGLFHAIAVWPAGFMIAFASTLAIGGYVQRIWLITHLGFISWAAWSIFEHFNV